jgi:hypothetical protein
MFCNCQEALPERCCCQSDEAIPERDSTWNPLDWVDCHAPTGSPTSTEWLICWQERILLAQFPTIILALERAA